MIDAMRTPDDRFDALPDFPWEPRYLEDLPGFEGLRLHYVDAGAPDADRIALCLHGEPTWSYLYRKMIPFFLEAGYRVIAPDFFGFGRSDKPVDDDVYTFDFHRDTILRVVEALDLSDLTLVCQDWGGLAGLTVPMDMPLRFDRLLVMNTALATGAPPSEGFLAWRDFVRSHDDLQVSRLMGRACPHLSDAELAAYDAPFPDASYKAGVRTFPEIVPVDEDMDGAETSRRALAWWEHEWTGEVFMAIGRQDPVLGEVVMRRLCERIAHCSDPLVLDEAGHFVQEWGAQVAAPALRTWGDWPG